MGQTQLNIVFIMADQLGAGCLGSYGSGVESTPTLDRLATDGTRFDRYYATAPVCAPNRATALTGRSPCVHGVVSNNYALATDMPTYAHVLRAHGYRTGGFGKFHQHPMPLAVPDDIEYLGFDESVITEDPKWGPWLEWIEREHPDQFDNALAVAWGPKPNTPPDLVARWREARERILAPLRAASAWDLMYPSPLPPELHDTTYITDLSLDFMRRHLDAHGDRPFLCHISYVDPHDPYDPPEPYAGMFGPDAMRDPLPAEWLDAGNAVLDASQPFFTSWPRVFDKPEVIRQLRAMFHGSLRFMDDQIARIIAFLHKRRLWESTIVLFTTDHGEMLGDHGLITKGVKHYDLGIRCPLIVAGGGIEAGVSDRLACTLDFYPTFCDWAGVDAAARPPLEGKSFAARPVEDTDVESWRDVSVAVSRVESVITDDGWRLTRFTASGEAQMFDLTNDPDEQRDVYGDPAYADKRQELLERLVATTTRPHGIPHYRNMPLLAGRKHTLGGLGGGQLVPGPPAYRTGTAPALDGRLD